MTRSSARQMPVRAIDGRLSSKFALSTVPQQKQSGEGHPMNKPKLVRFQYTRKHGMHRTYDVTVNVVLLCKRILGSVSMQHGCSLKQNSRAPV